MPIDIQRLLLTSILLWAGPIAHGQKMANMETVMLSPFQVFASSLELRAHYTQRQGRKILGYIRVKSVAHGSMPARAGLKKGDRIVAIGGWRLDGHELAELNRGFSTSSQDGVPVLVITVRRSPRDEECEITLRYPPKKQNEKGPTSERSAGP